MRRSVDQLETTRLDIQIRLDAAKSQKERNRLGQFATPPALANEIVAYAASLLPRGKISFLDPALGTGSFYSALLNSISASRIGDCAGYEIDADFGHAAARLWKRSGLAVKVADFTKQKPKTTFNLIVSNPPYVRHHHISKNEKTRLQREVSDSALVSIGGLSGLYCYFLGLSHRWMSEGGIAAWLLPSEFMDVNYGHALSDIFSNA